MCQGVTKSNNNHFHLLLLSIVCTSTLTTFISTPSHVKQTTVFCDLQYSPCTIGTIMLPIQPVLLLFHQFLMHEHVSKGSASVQNPPRGHNYPSFHRFFHSQCISLVKYNVLTSSDYKSNNQLPPYLTLYLPMCHLVVLYQPHSRPLPCSPSTTKAVWMCPQIFLQTRLLHQMQSSPFPFLPFLHTILALYRVFQWNHKVTHDLPPIIYDSPSFLCYLAHCIYYYIL